MLRLRAALLFVACIWLAASAGTQQPPQVHRNLRGTVRGPGTDRTRVTVWHNDMNKHAIEPIAEGFANADGTFAFDRVPWFARQQWGSQSVVVVARRNGQAGLVTLRSDEARTDQIDVTVAATIELGGRVHGADGKPLAGARVWPAVFGDSPNHQPKAWVTEPLLPWIAETGADGAFTLRGLPPLPPFQLRVEHPDHAKAWVDAGDGTEWVLAELQPGARIRGHVRLPDGTPAPRVRVAAAATGAGFGHTLSDEHGAFILTGLPAGRYKVWAEAPDLTVVAAAGIEATAGNVASDVTVQLTPGGFIVGTIVDAETGAPFVPGPWTDVAMYGPARPEGGACECTPVLQDGTFRIRAPAGANRIYLRSANGWSEPTETVTVVDGQETKVEWKVRRGRAQR